MSNTLTDLVNKIQYLTGQTREQVAQSINYSRQHLTKEMKKENESIQKMLEEKYKDTLQNGKKVTVKNIGTEIQDTDRIRAMEAMIYALKVLLAEHESKISKISFSEAQLKVDSIIQSSARQHAILAKV